MKKIYILYSIILFFSIIFIYNISANPYNTYNYEIPDNSFGTSNINITILNETYFKEFFNDCFSYVLYYKVNEFDDWSIGNQFANLNKTWVDSGYWKINLSLFVPVSIYDARFVLTIDKQLNNYIEINNSVVYLNYSIYDNYYYNVIFDYSDIANIDGIYFNKTIYNDKLLLSFGKQNIPYGYYVFDPSFGYTEVGSETFSIRDMLFGGLFESDGNGNAYRISAYIGISGADKELTCGLYNSDSELIAQTEKVMANSQIEANDWVDFDFEGIEPKINDTESYYIIVFGDTGTGTLNAYYNVQAIGQSIYSYSLDYSGVSGNLPENPTFDNEGSSDVCSIYCSYNESGTPPFVNTVPTVEPITPLNNSINQNQSGYFNCWFNDSDGNFLNITWFYFDGSFYHNFGNNNSVACNNTYDIYLPNFYNDSCSINKWKIEFDDGYINTTRNFTFSTECITEFINTVPTVEPITPLNNSINQNQSGYFNCWFNDSDGNFLNITWFYFDGSFYHNFGNNNSVACNNTYDIYLPNFYNDSCSINKWKIEFDDGYINTTRNFTFSTECIIPEVPSTINITSQYPLSNDSFNPLSEVFGFDIIGAINFNVLVYLSDDNTNFFLWEYSYNTNIDSYYFITTNYTFYNNSNYYWYLNLTEFGNETNTFQSNINTFTVEIYNNVSAGGNLTIGENMEINIVNTQFWYIILCLFWLFITWVNVKDVYEKQINKFNAIVHVFFTAPLFILILHDSYINSLIYGYFFAFGIIFTSIYITALKFIFVIKTDSDYKQ